jgi:glycogen synthase kinase 3 beta
VVTVTASSGKTGAEVQISYTSCKVVGNGSFGVVFAAKMLGELGCYRRIVHWFKH